MYIYGYQTFKQYYMQLKITILIIIVIKLKQLCNLMV